ncbi:diaminobutyrate--2-oxoglutarate transaminase family protein [Lentzea alba]|uniref:diaminobutyrate--2-oxoglutarate transaminase family protein n=1 Tax=Lentzea alba TaxID=2714351 RepID=UPI0039BF6156
MTTSKARTRSLADWFLLGYTANPDGIALRVGTVELSYQHLHDRARRAAAGILAVTGPVRPRVGVLARRSAEGYVGVLAAALCGGAAVPLNPDFPAPRLRQMVAAAGVSVLVADESGLAMLQSAPEVLRDLPVAVGMDGPADLGPESWSDPAAVAYVLFTSGSTGAPKGVPVTNSQVDHYLHVVHERYSFQPTDVFSQNFDLTFDLAMFDMFAAWGCGGTLVTIPSTAMASLPRYLERHGVTVWFSAPSAIALARRWKRLEPGAFPTLRWSLFCGEPLLAVDAADWQAAAPLSTVENLYGPTELTISCSAHRWDPEASPAQSVNGIVSIGALHRGLEFVLLDHSGTVTEGTGELCVAGPQTFSGYLDPRHDEGRFVEHAGTRWYRTGDLVRVNAQGELNFLGRHDRQVQVRGVRIELAEVDHAVSSCDGVVQAVTLQAADGELVAFYTGEVRDSAALIRELACVLPRTAIPGELRHLDAFPLNSNGKIDQAALRTKAATPQRSATVMTALPGPESRRLLDRQASRESSARAYPVHSPIAIAGGEGSYLRDADGNVFLDFLTGAGVLALGHNHPDLVAAAHAQLDVHTHLLDFPSEAKDTFTDLILGTLPPAMRGRYKIHFCGPTGADGVDAAIKLCKTHTGRGEVIAFQGGFHGSTQSTLAVSGLVGPKEPVQNMLPGVAFFPYSSCFACPLGLKPDSCSVNCVQYLENALDDVNGGLRRPAAVLLELVQGEGGVVPARKEFAQRVRDLTRRLGIPLVVDEVQSGCGRTGTWFAFEQYGIEPDVVVLSKALGGGHPVSVILYHERLDRWESGAHTGTFRGNQLAFAAGAELMRVFERDRVLDNVREISSRLLNGLYELASEHEFIGDVRGLGMMLGAEVISHQGHSAHEIAALLHSTCLRRGLLFELAGRNDNVLRFLPPLNLTAREAHEALDILRATFTEVGADLKPREIKR